MKPWLNVSEAAEYAGLSRDTIYTACEQEELRSARVSGRRTIRIRPAWIDAWLERYAPDVQGRRRIRTPAENDIAGKQALVLSTLAIGDYRILRCRRGWFYNWLLHHGGCRRCLNLLGLARFHGTETFLVIT
jgi:excisionase family DNA binding protein